jgi:hypothetical protein
LIDIAQQTSGLRRSTARSISFKLLVSTSNLFWMVAAQQLLFAAGWSVVWINRLEPRASRWFVASGLLSGVSAAA